MSSTFFTASPQWRWFIVAYFFLGGLAGGSYFLATLLDRFGTERDRPLVRLGYLVAFPIVCLCGLVLTVDLGRSERSASIRAANSARAASCCRPNCSRRALAASSNSGDRKSTRLNSSH